MKKFFLYFILILPLFSNEIKCNIENEKIYCKYFIDRSDNENGKKVLFIWHSPSGNDDRVREFDIPPFYGSVYDYRYLPGREKGKWRVVVKDLDTNSSVETTFVIDEENDEFFEE